MFVSRFDARGMTMQKNVKRIKISRCGSNITLTYKSANQGPKDQTQNNSGKLEKEIQAMGGLNNE